MYLLYLNPGRESEMWNVECDAKKGGAKGGQRARRKRKGSSVSSSSSRCPGVSIGRDEQIVDRTGGAHWIGEREIYTHTHKRDRTH